MQVNITCDRRIIYGADAAAFLQDLVKLIESRSTSLIIGAIAYQLQAIAIILWLA